MKRSIIALSAIAAMWSSSFASTISQEDLMKQIEALKAQISALESKVGATESTSKANKESLEKMMKGETPVTVSDERFKKLEKKVSRIDRTAKTAKIQSAGDNIKWDIDFRTQFDNIEYEHVSGRKTSNHNLLTNRLWLGAAYAPNDHTVFHGKLSYNKAFGDSANHNQSNTNPGYANFDWVTNENALDNEVKVKEAYWLYKDKTLFGADIPWTVSVGRRPSTDGLPINLRNNQRRNSPLSHIVDVEFDGFSIKLDTEKVTGFTGSWFKICGGRGLTNAKARFQNDGTDYAEDDDLNENVDMLGVIAVPYDDGQYSVHMQYAHAWNLIGFDQDSLTAFNNNYGAYLKNPTSDNAYAMQMSQPSFKDVGDIDFATILFKSEGIGNGISDYLDDTIFFASFAMSKTHPNDIPGGMLGTDESKTGYSYWLGINAPCPITPDSARVGVEFNHGSQYWRSMTYGEDTYAGSKIAARGDAWEVYRNQKINKALSWGLSYVYIDYDYMGSNSFFGADGTPYSIDSNYAKNTDAVESAQDVRAYVRYKF
ncbi:DUF3373 family protein [Halarcobacter anaerophilus]|uniref:DUF3373 family protein n=1 Tax=Halarcobacter anaerophilus TaxID=877500 RepID=UPI0005CA5F3D|nr:DUF3373 family protein [Halarcobacter anaerophilus]